MAASCATCGTTKASSYGHVLGNLVCDRCSFLALTGTGAEQHPNCPPRPPPEEDGLAEALEATVDAFLDTPNVDDKMSDELTDVLATAFEKGEGESAHAMEQLLSQVLLPVNKMVRIHGLTEAAELNGRVGVLVSGSARMGSAPISLVPSDAAPAVQWHLRLLVSGFIAKFVRTSTRGTAQHCPAPRGAARCCGRVQ